MNKLQTEAMDRNNECAPMEPEFRVLPDLGGAAVRGEAVAVDRFGTDEAEALYDLRKSVLEGATDEWLLGFIRQYPFITRADQIKLGAPSYGSVSARAADAPSEPSEHAKFQAAYARINNSTPGGGWADLNGGTADYCEPDVQAAWLLWQSHAADALDSQPTEKISLDALIARIDAAAVAICAEKYGPEKDEPKFDRDQTIAEIIDLRAEYEVASNPGEFDSSDDASSQPTDGGVRNGS